MGIEDNITQGQLRALSLIGQRAAISARLGKQFGGRRDLYEVLGYVRDPKFDDYFGRYDRQDIAGNIVDRPAQATWRMMPRVLEDDDDNTQTPLEEAWESLSKRLRVGHYLERVDKLSGIGHYAILLIGVRGSTNLASPLNDGSLRSPDDIIYLAPYSEKSAAIDKLVDNPADPRFGLPELYRVQISSGGKNTLTKLVHHTRVIHVADGLLEDGIYGRPRLKRVLNLLDDMAKVVGGGAEMFWRAAERGLHANVDAGADIGPEESKQLEEEIESYIHGLRRFIRTQGMDINVLQGQISDPRGVFDVVMSLISGASGIPKRVLLGAERGELASTQDETNWNSYVKERQINFAEPMVLRPLIDRFLRIGALPPLREDDYKVEWPSLFELSDTEKAELNLKTAQAIQAYAPMGETDRVVPVSEFREKVLGLEPDHPDLKEIEDDFNDPVELEGGDNGDLEDNEEPSNDRPPQEGES